MKQIFYGSFNSLTGIQHDILIYDRLSNPPETPVELILRAPGYVLNHNSNVTDIISYGLIESSLKFTVQNTNNILDSFLASLMITENRYLVEVKRDGVSFWKGILLSDFGNVEDAAYSGISFEAVDGLKLLSGIDVEIIDPNEKHSFLDYIIKALSLVKTVDFFDVDEAFLRIKTDWYASNMFFLCPMEPLDLVSCDDTEGDFLWATKATRIGWSGVEIIEIKTLSYYDMLQKILQHFMITLGMNNGVWYAVQRDLYETANTISYFQYDKSGQLLFSAPLTPEYCTESTYQTIAPASDTYRNAGKFSFLPGLKKAEITYIANARRDEEINNWNAMYEPTAGCSLLNTLELQELFSGLESGLYQTYKLYSGTGNYLDCKFDWIDEYSVPTSLTSIWNAIVTCYLEVKLVGDSNTYYLRQYYDPATGLNYSWTVTPVLIPITAIGVLGTVVINSTAGMFPTAAVNNAQHYKSEFRSPDLPVDGIVHFTVTRGPVTACTGPLNPNGNPNLPTITYFGWSPVDEQNWIFFIQNDEQPSSSIYFSAENDNQDFTLVNTLEDNVFGTAGSSSRGFLEIWDGNEWVAPIIGSLKKWRKGTVAAFDKFFNELLVDETLANQENAVLCFNGNIEFREATSLCMFRTISMVYKGYTYRMWANNVNYSANDERWSGDWFAIKRNKRTWQIVISPAPISMPGSDNMILGSAVAAIDRLNLLQVTDDAITVDDHVINSDAFGLQSANKPRPIPASGVIQFAIGSRIINMDSFGNRSAVDDNDLVVYGYLYSYYTLDYLASSAEWRVPNDTDINDLYSYITGLYPGGDEGLHVRSIRQDGTSVTGGDTTVEPYFENSVLEGLDTLNLGLIPGGCYRGGFTELHQVGYYWTTAMGYEPITIRVHFDTGTLDISWDAGDAYSMFSVRLVRDASSTEAGLEDGTYVDDYVGNDGKKYAAVKIGDYVWMAENLAETKNNNGTSIIYGIGQINRRTAYNANNALAVQPGSIRSIVSNTAVFTGAGTADSPFTLANAADNIVYGIINGTLTPVTDRRYAGVYTKPTFTDNGDGTITIGAGVYNLYHTTDNSGHIYQHSIAGAGFSPTDKTVMYIYADYNAGTPQIALTNNPENINQSSKQIIFTIYRDGNTVQRIEWDEPSKGLSDKLHNRLIKTERFKKEFTGGLVLSETAGNIVNISSGNVWYGAVRKTMAAYVSNVDELTQYYHVGGVWTAGTRSTYNNFEYDDGTDLVELTNNKYTVNWVYRLVGDDVIERAAIVLGNSQYQSAGDATVAPLPEIPDVVLKIGILVGRIIVQKSAASGTVENVQDFTFVGGASPATLPGGNDTEVQFNDAATFAGDSTFTFNKTTKEIGGQTIFITRDIKLTNTTNANQYGVIQKGAKRFIHDFNYGNNGSVTTEGKNIFIGEESGNFTMGSTAIAAHLASYNVGIGYRTLYGNTTGTNNIAIGKNSLVSNTTGNGNIAIGYQSMTLNTTGENNTAVGGYYTLGYLSTGSNNVCIGSSTGKITTGSDNVAIGYNCMFNNAVTGSFNIAIGQMAGGNITSGVSNFFAGYRAGLGVTTTGANIAIGNTAQYAASGSSNITFGTYAGFYLSGSYNIAIGEYALGRTAGVSAGAGNIGIGYSSLGNNSSGNYSVSIGQAAMFSNLTGSHGVAIGYQSQYYANNTTTPWTNSNVSIGYNSLRGSTTAANNTGVGNTAIGYEAMLSNSSGGYNVFIGFQCGYSNSSGYSNCFAGYQAGYYNTQGFGNTGFGAGALVSSAYSVYNTAIGGNALYYLATGNNSNTALGTNAGRNYTGDANLTSAVESLFLGANTKAKANGETNQIVIGYNATGLGSNTAVIGNSSITITRLQGSVGIGTDAPAAKLQVIGDCRFGGATDYTEFEADGTRHANGAATTWRDELNSLVGQKLESPSSHITTNYDDATLDFDTSCSLSDFVYMNIQLNHDWKIGSNIYPHLHYVEMSPDGYTPNWLIEYRWQKNGAEQTSAWTRIAVSSVTFTPSEGINQIAVFSSITPPSGAGLSDIVQIKIYRDFNNASGLFSDSDPVLLTVPAYSFDIHIECDTDGSRSEYTK